MKSPIAPMDDFATLPLLTLLPKRGSPRRLEELTSSIFARYEAVRALSKSTIAMEREISRRFSAEETMLRSVLDWLNLTTTE